MTLQRKKDDGTFAVRLGTYSATAMAALALAPAANAAITDITSFTITSGSSASSAAPSLAMPGLNSSASLGFKFGGGFSASLNCFNRKTTQPVTSFGSIVGHSTRHSNKSAKLIPKGNLLLAGVNAAQLIPLGGAIKGMGVETFTAGTHVFGRRTRNFSSVEFFGAFAPPANGAKTGYIGFKADENGKTYYGWLRVKVNGGADGAPDLVSLVAANGDPGVYGAYGLASDDILAGEVAVPEPSSTSLSGLALLALGAAGVREMRRRKSAAQPLPP